MPTRRRAEAVAGEQVAMVREQRDQAERAETAASREQAERLRDRERLLAETPDLPDVLEDLHARLMAPVCDVDTTAALRAALRRVFSHFELSARPPAVLPVAVSPDDVATAPEEPVSASQAAAIAAEVGEGLGVTVPDDGPFWSEQRLYSGPAPGRRRRGAATP